MSQMWQHPYVNLFKHFQVQEWKKASKEGEVVSAMDRTCKCTVYKVTGSIPAGNYIQLPKTSSQSLGLTGRYLYLLFKPVPGKYFVVHIDVATHDGLIVRISFSNLFKEFKATSTWLQFPFVCHAAKGSISDKAGVGSRDHIGPAPLNTRWTALCLDFASILTIYLSRRYAYVKSIRLCANMVVKNVFTSDSDYEPGLSFDKVKKSGLKLQGVAPMPREMSFPLSKTQVWHDLYDHIKFPSDTTKKPFDSVQYTKTNSEPDTKKTILHPGAEPHRVNSRVVSLSGRAAPDRSSVMESVTQPRVPYKKKHVVSELPRVGVDSEGSVMIDSSAPPPDSSHVYAHPADASSSRTNKAQKGPVISKSHDSLVQSSRSSVDQRNGGELTSLRPDPILKLRRIVGFGGSSTRDALWTKNGTMVVYPCHAVVVAMQVSNGHQAFFIGHTDKVSSIALNGSSTLLASGQSGPQSVVRVWNFISGECLAMFKTHAHSLHCLSMSHSGGVLCGVGKDNHGKNMVVIWNTRNVSQGGQVSVIAKAHTDVDITRMRIAFFDDTRMVSCGRDNVRLWRVKDGQLRSAPVNLGEYHLMEFTDCCFEAGYEATKDPLDRLVYVCSKAGHVFEIDYSKVAIKHVRRLMPTQNKNKQNSGSGSGISINAMTVNEAFCVTGSDDGFLRLWPLDFKHVYLEAEHEGPVTAVDICADGTKILAGTCTGNVGILDISSRGYTTVMRSHTKRISSLTLDPLRRHMATVSDDHSIRVWDLHTMQQLYDFSAAKECPMSICFHPEKQLFACGFESGSVRVFNVANTSMIAEHRQHRGKITGLTYSPHGDYLYSADSLGTLVLYDATNDKYRLARVLANTVARDERLGPDALSVSADGRFVAFVGPNEFTVSVVDSRSLDEVLRLDISSLSTDTSRTTLDSAVKVKYTPQSVKQLLVVTSSNKLLKFDARTGKILTQLENIHRSGCQALDVSRDGRYLATAGDKAIKIWDYHMRLDINFQLFIGHAAAVSRVLFAPDDLTFISAGEAIFIWDFLAHKDRTTKLEGRTSAMSYFSGKEEEFNPYAAPGRTGNRPETDGIPDTPRKSVPKPLSYEPGGSIANISNIERSTFDPLQGVEVQSTLSEKEEIIDASGDFRDKYDSQSDYIIAHKPEAPVPPLVIRHSNPGTPTKLPTTTTTTSVTTGTTRYHDDPRSAVISAHARGGGDSDIRSVNHPAPRAAKHFMARQKNSSLAQRRYTAPPNQAGLKLQALIGYNGNGRGNMVWNPDTGVFAYSSGCTVIVEDLNAGTQQHLKGHHEEISTLALQHDCQTLVSASCSSCDVSSCHDDDIMTSPSCQLLFWDLTHMTCKKLIRHDECYAIVCLAYSRDDRFLVSLSDYRTCKLTMWCAQNHTILTTTTTSQPQHSVSWDPYSCNELASVGCHGSVLFWLLDETAGRENLVLNLHQATLPRDLLPVADKNSVELTCLEYAGDSTLYIGTNTGHITAWDTRQNRCFLHWHADNKEISVLVSKNGRLVSGSYTGLLKMWSIGTVGEMRLPSNEQGVPSNQSGVTMDDEMTLDGLVTSAAFDDTLDMGIVGTSAGTLWYINWVERASIRLVSGHSSKIMDLAVCGNELLATGAKDGCLRVWSLKDKEQTLQFQVMDQSCNCLAFAPQLNKRKRPTQVMFQDPTHPNPTTSAEVSSASGKSSLVPNIVAGYSDGTVRMFDVNKVEMMLKMHPHAASVTAISFSSDGSMIMSGAEDGLVAISSPTTGMTVRVINDHRGAPISCLDVTLLQEERDLSFSAPQLWLAVSADRRVSVWSADWSKDFCELVDWLTFPAPAFTPDGAVLKAEDEADYSQVPPSLARFSYEEQDVVIYTGYGMNKHIQFYSLSERKVLRTISLTQWASSLDVCPSTPLLSVGNSERLLKLLDYYEGSFQDFLGHDDTVRLTRFSADGSILCTASHNELMIWTVAV